MLTIEEEIWHGDTMVLKSLLPYPLTFIYYQDNINIGDTMERTCKQCGKKFLMRKSHVERGGGIFCSKKCWGKWLSENISGKDGHGWKGGKVKRICQVCGKEFEVFPCYVKNGGGKFCSNLCNRNAQPKHHTKPELIFEEICKKYDLHFKYTGDGSLWIGKKKKLNPDFIQADGQKIVIEIFGDYWHSPLLRKTMRNQDTLDYRKRHYKKYNWQSVFIWESDLLREDAEQFVLKMLEAQKQ